MKQFQDLDNIRQRERNYCPKRAYLRTKVHFDEFNTIESTNLTNINEMVLSKNQAAAVNLTGSLAMYNPHCKISQAHYLKESTTLKPEPYQILELMQSQQLTQFKLPDIKQVQQLSNTIQNRIHVKHYKSIKNCNHTDYRTLTRLLSPQQQSANKINVQLPKIQQSAMMLTRW
ncbi:hypothetical protein SS50377_21834 [Spironucleus salmonicida]|uniref:Uncharacterized protein n=1 Tax=Spironucleus salmonicida TaxID=348837 RepID=V6LJ55_9EUKA|nr:hypothetical protein SS50377_21834 [Spironucleus salmonicida]|eukprot:EST44378.1 Hypothetical protein SS50377_15681 [Spironucleus salmonicida]